MPAWRPLSIGTAAATLALSALLASPSTTGRTDLPRPLTVEAIRAACGVPARVASSIDVSDLVASNDPFDRLVGQATAAALARKVEEAGKSRCVETAVAAACIAPDTDPAKIPELLAWLERIYGPRGAQSKYQKIDRWGSTATNASTGSTGDPITLTWSIVPDGTTIDGGVSTLNAVFDANFAGGHATWVARIAAALDRWDVRTGINYIQEVDDGAVHPANDGVLGVRGDVRIGGRIIDGSSAVLAYNFYPGSGGDMVLDTGDSTFYANAGLNYRNLFNVTAHEHGHGMGLAHVDPINTTKLMEANFSGSFLGPQDDDTRGGQNNYGDTRENNDDSTSASVLGSVVDSLRTIQLSLDRGGDIDWYQFTIGVPESVTIYVDPIGSTYLTGPEGGATASVSTDSILDLQFQLYDSTGTVLLATQSAVGLGATEVLSGFLLATPNEYLIRVLRNGAGGPNTIQRYELLIQAKPDARTAVGEPVVAGVVPGRLDVAVSPNPARDGTRATFRLAHASSYALEVFDLAGRRMRTIEGRAPGAGLVEIPWDGKTDRGDDIGSGVYMLRVTAGGLSETQRAVFVR